MRVDCAHVHGREVSGKRRISSGSFSSQHLVPGKRAVYGETYARTREQKRAAHSLFQVWIIDGAGILLFCVLSSSLSLLLCERASRIRNISRFLPRCVSLSPFSHQILQASRKNAGRRKFRLLLCLSAERFSIRPADHKIFSTFHNNPASSVRPPNSQKQEMKNINKISRLTTPPEAFAQPHIYIDYNFVIR